MKRGLFVLVSIALAAATANAYVLDWTEVDYATGATYQQFTNVDGSGVGMEFQWVDGVGNPGGNFLANLPNDEDGLLPIYPNAEPGLWYATGNNNDVSVNIIFSELVSDISFSIYDIDGTTAGWESVRIKGFDADNNPVDMSNYSFSYGSGVELVTGIADFGVQFKNFAGPDPNPGQTGWQNNMATIAIDNGVQIKKIGIAFLNNDGERGQILTDITFVPEPATLALLALGMAALRIRRK